MSHVEEALAEAKKLPTDGFVSFEPSKDVESERKLNSRCAVEIVHSLKDSRFTLAYQPIFNVHTQEVEYYEALLRMRCESGEVVPAGHLVPIAEKIGLIRLIDRAVVSNVLTILRRYPTKRVALNISGVTANDPRWFEKLTNMFAENKDLTDRLTIEITETVALENIDQTVGFIEKLHDLGCKVAIDDFGAGFTSFRNLKLLNVDKVKIDGSFCLDLSNNPENQYFVKTLIDLAKNFNLLTVAEWVETQEDADLLTSWGVDYLQGRLHGMAQDCSDWGEPVIETDEICVVPSEIFDTTSTLPEPETTDSADVNTNLAVESENPEISPLPVDQNLNVNEPFIAQTPVIKTGHEASPFEQGTVQTSPPVFESDQETTIALEPSLSLPQEMGVPFEVMSQPNLEPIPNIEASTIVDLQTNAVANETFPIPNVTTEITEHDIESIETHEPLTTPEAEEATPISNEMIDENASDNQEIQHIVEDKKPTPTMEILSESQLDDELRKLREAIQILGHKNKHSPTGATINDHDSAQDNDHADQSENYAAVN